MSEKAQYNILIVDEDEATRCTLADLLRWRDEYRVLVAGEGREAIRMFVEEARIDIVLTDIHMPGFNCMELMSDMQRLKHRPEILVMTSNGSPEVIEQARQIGARSIILKPFEHLDLIEAEVEKAVQALFEARVTSSCKMMAPPSVKRNAAAPTATPPPAAAKPEAPVPIKPEPAAAAKPEAVAPAPEATPPAPEPTGPGVAAPSTRTHDAPSPAGPPPAARPAPSEMIAGEESFFLGNETPDPGHGAPDDFSTAMPAKSEENAGMPPSPAATDAGLTMKIDRPDFAVAPTPPAAHPSPDRARPEMPAAQPAPEQRQPEMPATQLSREHRQPETAAIANGAGAKPDAAASPVQSGGGPRRSPATDRMRGRVGLPNLGALKTKLFGKGVDLKGGQLARGGFSVPAPTGASPAASPDPVAVAKRPAPRPEPVAAIPSPAPTGEPVVPPLEIAHGLEPVKSPAPPAAEAEPAMPPQKSAKGEDPIAPPVETAQDAVPMFTPVEIVQDADPIVPTAETAETPGPEQSESVIADTAPAAPVAVVPTADADEADRQEGAGDPERSNGENGDMGSDEPMVSTAGDANGGDTVTVPAEFEAILEAGAAVDLDKMTLQIPIICLQTWEEQTALDVLRPLAGSMKRAFHTWSATRGIVKEDGTVMGEMYCDPIQALEFVRRQKANGLYVLVDFRSCLDDRKVVRMLREMFDAGETGRGMLVLTAPVIPVPPELQTACQLFDWPAGGAVDFDQVLEEVRTELSTPGDDAIDLDPEARRLLIERVQGMPVGRARFEFLCALRGRGQHGS